MKNKVNPSDYYPNLKDNPYPEFTGDDVEVNSISFFRRGDVVFDLVNNCIAIVLGDIDMKAGTLRLDTDGIQPMESLRFATLEDFQLCQYRTTEIHQTLFLECCSQQGVAPVRFQVEATIKKNVMVFVSATEDMDEDEIIEAGRELAHYSFNPLSDGTEEKYNEISSYIPNLFDPK